jgi:hypothetical protein
MRRAISEGIKEGEAIIHHRVLKNTGFLDSTIQSSDDGNGKGEIEVGADYGVFVEYGTSFSEGQPYFRPGLDAARQKIKAGMKIKDK